MTRTRPRTTAFSPYLLRSALRRPRCTQCPRGGRRREDEVRRGGGCSGAGRGGRVAVAGKSGDGAGEAGRGGEEAADGRKGGCGGGGGGEERETEREGSEVGGGSEGERTQTRLYKNFGSGLHVAC